MKYDKRIAVRLPAEEKAKVEQLIQKGKFKNLSHAIRTALQQFFKGGKNVDASK